MKKNYFYIGFAFAIFCLGLVIGRNYTTQVSTTTTIVSPKEAMTAYMRDRYSERDIKNVEVYDISHKGFDGVEYVSALVTVDGKTIDVSIPSSYLNKYGF